MLILVVVLLVPWSTTAEAASGAVGIHSIAACKDGTTVAVIGSSTYANNRVRVDLYYRNPVGQEELKQQFHSAPMGAGRISLAVPLNYAKQPVPAGSLLRVDVQLQYLSGSDYVDVGGVARQYVTVADKSCLGLCSVTVDTLDVAPASGTLTLRSHYGSWFRPEGRLYAAVPLRQGYPARVTYVGIPCGWTVRAWYYPHSGDTTPKMLPSQYWPHEFAATLADGTNPYTTAFSRGLAATHPIEPDDPFVIR
jgi:hypothetical protein